MTIEILNVKSIDHDLTADAFGTVCTHDPMTLRCQGIETQFLAREWEFASHVEGSQELGGGILKF